MLLSNIMHVFLSHIHSNIKQPQTRIFMKEAKSIIFVLLTISTIQLRAQDKGTKSPQYLFDPENIQLGLMFGNFNKNS